MILTRIVNIIIILCISVILATNCPLFDIENLFSFNDAISHCRLYNAFPVENGNEFATVYDHWTGLIKYRLSGYQNKIVRLSTFCEINTQDRVYRSMTNSNRSSGLTGVRCERKILELSYEEFNYYEINDEMNHECIFETIPIPVGTTETGVFCANSCTNHQMNVCYGFYVKATNCQLIVYRKNDDDLSIYDDRLNYFNHKFYLRRNVCSRSHWNKSPKPFLRNGDDIIYLVRGHNGHQIEEIGPTKSGSDISLLYSSSPTAHHFKRILSPTTTFKRYSYEVYASNNRVIQIIFKDVDSSPDDFKWFQNNKIINVITDNLNWQVSDFADVLLEFYRNMPRRLSFYKIYVSCKLTQFFMLAHDKYYTCLNSISWYDSNKMFPYITYGGRDSIQGYFSHYSFFLSNIFNSYS
ncbi:hypothetical protein SNEBB_009844 [Seison nebaliae]|nr:hypothetical protein SNEBB_009844 [Seison nebaliae]